MCVLSQSETSLGRVQPIIWLPSLNPNWSIYDFSYSITDSISLTSQIRSQMFNTKLMEVNEYASNHHDSFSSGSDHEDQRSHGTYHRRKSQSPHRAIPHAQALTIDQKARAGIFVVDPFHCRINVEFLKAFAKHHSTQPIFVSKQSTYFTSSSEEDEGAVLDLAPDMSYMGFTTSSSSEDEQSHNHHTSFDSWDIPIKPAKKSSRNGNGTSSKKSKSSSSSTANSAKIVNSSSLPRPADNSDKFPLNLSPETIAKLANRVNSNYKSFPQNQRHGSTPMDISTCPGVRLLTEDEYIACSLLRIRPALYFHARNTLLHNYHHSVGYFRKSAAQKMLRIDVNKTGKLYDFLVRQNWMPESEGADCRPEPEQVIIDDPETYHQL